MNTSLLRKLQFSAFIKTLLQCFSESSKIGKKVLDIGAGRCFLANDLLKHGIDMSIVEPQSHLPKKHFHGNLDKIYQNIEQVPIDEKFDAIIISSVLQCVQNPENILLNIQKNMHVDSLLLTSVPNVYHNKYLFTKSRIIWDNMGGVDGVGAYSPTDFEQMLRFAGFRVVSLSYIPNKLTSFIWEFSLIIWYKTGISYNLIFWCFYPLVYFFEKFFPSDDGCEYLVVAKTIK